MTQGDGQKANMARWTAEMVELVREERLGYVATVSANGSPNVSPKGSLTVGDEEHLSFADIESPHTITHLVRDPRVEVSVVDPFSRKGFRFRGKGTVERSGSDDGKALERYQKEGADVRRIRAIVFIAVERVQPLISPVHLLGVNEEDVRRLWEEHPAKRRHRTVVDLIPPQDFEVPVPRDAAFRNGDRRRRGALRTLFPDAAPALSDALGIAEPALGVLLGAGSFLAGSGRIRLHAYVQSAVIFANLPIVLVGMLPRYLAKVLPELPGELGQPYGGVPTIMLGAGGAAEALGIYIVLVAATTWIPERSRFRRYQLVMRWELALFRPVRVVGLSTYYVCTSPGGS